MQTTKETRAAAAPVESSATSTFEWAKRIGIGFRREAHGLSENAMALLRVAFLDVEDEPRGRVGPGEILRRHDRAIGVAVVLSGLSPRALEERARREGRSFAFAEGAAWAHFMGERDPESFRAACLVFRRLRSEWEEGVAATMLDIARPLSGPTHRRAQSFARNALAAKETWAIVGQLRARRARDEGFVESVHDEVDDARFLRDAAYRMGVIEALTVCAQAGERVARVEAAHRRARCPR